MSVYKEKAASIFWMYSYVLFLEMEKGMGAEAACSLCDDNDGWWVFLNR